MFNNELPCRKEYLKELRKNLKNILETDNKLLLIKEYFNNCKEIEKQNHILEELTNKDSVKTLEEAEKLINDNYTYTTINETKNIIENIEYENSKIEMSFDSEDDFLYEIYKYHKINSCLTENINQDEDIFLKEYEGELFVSYDTFYKEKTKDIICKKNRTLDEILEDYKKECKISNNINNDREER